MFALDRVFFYLVPRCSFAVIDGVVVCLENYYQLHRFISSSTPPSPTTPTPRKPVSTDNKHENSTHMRAATCSDREREEERGRERGRGRDLHGVCQCGMWHGA